MLRNQSYPSFECLVIDDGSSDGTPALCREITGDDPRFRIFDDFPNHNVAKARKAGIEKARGDLIAILDQDDLWHKDKLLAQVQVMQMNPEADMCFTGHQNFTSDRIPPPSVTSGKNPGFKGQ